MEWLSKDGALAWESLHGGRKAAKGIGRAEGQRGREEAWCTRQAASAPQAWPWLWPGCVSLYHGCCVVLAEAASYRQKQSWGHVGALQMGSAFPLAACLTQPSWFLSPSPSSTAFTMKRSLLLLGARRLSD